jgi:hypothetical protein
MHDWPVAQGVLCISQAPEALQVKLEIAPVPAQTAALQAAPGASRRQPPFPSQPLVQGPLVHIPLGSAPPAGTGAQVPWDPASAHDRHTPSHAVAQHRPWAHTPGPSHSSPREQADPMGRLPQDPCTQGRPPAHWALVVQEVAQRFPVQPWKGAQERTADRTHMPPLHAPEPVAALEAGSQPPSWQTVPSGYSWQPRFPSHRPLVPQEGSPWSRQTPAAPPAVPAGSALTRGSRTPAGVATQCPGVLGKAQ